MKKIKRKRNISFEKLNNTTFLFLFVSFVFVLLQLLRLQEHKNNSIVLDVNMGVEKKKKGPLYIIVL